ncbi:MAG: hypothetical protein M3513_17660 [Actinomycetota bacterium]|nr:hypothetical protein [Actinomycetota bacterium]
MSTALQEPPVSVPPGLESTLAALSAALDAGDATTATSNAGSAMLPR